MTARRTSSSCWPTTSATPTSGCYGSEIDTPNLDALARRGIQATNFHVTPMCSPTRAALLTGCEPHRAGLGTVAHCDPGFPGYASELAPDVMTMAEILRDEAGYATMAVGKWHLAKDSDGAGGSRASWPCQRGFDQYYGVIDAFTNLHHPHRLVQDNHQVDVDRYPDGYYFTDDITDHAISMIRAQKTANPARPFLCYVAHGAVHAPLHVRPEDAAKYRGRYDAGWDALRAERFARQQELGVVPPGVEVAPRNTERDHDVKPWDDLSPEEQRLFARHMEVYAGMVDRIDQNIGRMIAALDDLGELDNTIFVFTSDNGASREGEECGTTAYYVHLLQGDDIDADLARIDEIGGPTTTPHYPRGWAMAGNTPFRLYKINTHQGGHSVPFIVSWPDGVDARGEFRRQYQHVTDLLPTFLEIVGVDRPATRNGVELAPLQGWSMTSVLADADAPNTHREHVVEMNGHRGYYREGWHAVTLHHGLTSFTDESVGALRPRCRPHRAARPRRRAPREAGRAHRGVGGRGVGEPDLPARRGCERQVRGAARDRPAVRDAGPHPARHTDARALAVGPADLVPRDSPCRWSWSTTPAPRACSSPTATRARATSCTCSTASSCSRTTTGAGT